VPGRAFVEVAGVRKSFPAPGGGGSDGRVVALDGVDLTIEQGEVVSLIGPSGCGKSTLVRLIGGLSRPDDGRLVVAGEDPARARATKSFALAPQTPALLPWRTVRDNARLLVRVNRGAERHRVLGDDEIDALLHEVGLGAFLDARPRQLSGGMQQRVSLVRAFALGAPVLLMDEPFAALDEITRAEMRYLLLRLWGAHRSTIVFVTHSIPEAVMLSDRVVVMAPRPGRIVAVEPVTLPRPRHEAQEETVEFLGHVTRVRHALQAAMAA
jgi:NitT/TauT family transport system ATP-binding protein